MAMRHIGDGERRARLARRHGVAPAHRFADVVTATRAMTALHATEPPTVYLSLVARVDGVGREDVDAALYADRSLVKQLAMRRTLFVFPRDALPAAWGSASVRVAKREADRTAADVERHGIAEDGAAWVEAAAAEILTVVSDAELSARDVRAALPSLDARITLSPGKRYEANVSVLPRILTLLGARGDIVRAVNDGSWRVSRPCWTAMARWLDGDVPAPLDEAAGYAELVGSWLATFGPGTEDDVVWWLGATKTVVRRALVDVGAVEVALDGGQTGYVLADDLEPEPDGEPWAALLPVLDPTTMGWRHRGFYLDPDHVPYLFDTNGNGGTTAWWNGRVVGCWVQDGDGAVEVVLREDVGADARAALDAEAARLTDWLAGDVVNSVYASAQMRGDSLP